MAKLHENPPIHKIPTGKGRFSIPVSLFRGCADKNIKALSFATIGDIFREMQNPSSDQQAFGERLRNAYGSEKYKEIKEGLNGETGCPAFILGQFMARENGACRQYVPLLGFDIDKSDPDLVAVNLEACRESPYIFAAYPSPSWRGLRLFVWANSTPDTHKAYYKAISEHLSEVLRIPTDKELRKAKREGEYIDTGNSNISRLWFYTPVPKSHWYMNQDSKVFHLVEDQAAGKEPVKERPPTPPPAKQPITDEVKIALCLRKVTEQQHIHPVAGNRNNFVFAFACELCRHGVDQGRALSECLAYSEAGFDEAEIGKTVSSAYQGKVREFDDAQIRRYLENGNDLAMATPPAALPPAEEQPAPADQEEEPEEEDDEEENNKAKLLEEALKRRWDFRFNVITRMPEFRPKGKGDFQRMDDYALNSITRQLRLISTPGANRTRIAETIESGFAQMVNPIEAYFMDLKPDGADHIGKLCSTVTALEGQKDMFRKYLEKWLVGAVANVFTKNRCANHLCFILTGEQGAYKSTWIRLLCPPSLIAYYFEGNLDPENKDDLFATTANFIYNLDDYFAEVTKKKINSLKSFITKDTVNARRAYGRYPEELPKICSFIASSNDDTFLHDPTGNRRFVPFEVTAIDIEAAKAINVNQVWAQAYKLFKEGFIYWLTREDQQELSEHNTKYEVQSMEYELVQKHFRKPATREEAEQMTAADIYDYLSNRSLIRITQKKLGEAMKKAGYERYQKREGGSRTWVYAVEIIENCDRAEEKTTTPEPDPF